METNNENIEKTIEKIDKIASLTLKLINLKDILKMDYLTDEDKKPIIIKIKEIIKEISEYAELI
jgi:hypothetical protein